MTCRLNEAVKEKDVTIKEITDKSVYEQLGEQGFTVGSTVKVISKLPFNGAIACEINNTRFAIRAENAASIIVFD